ncbi:MAG: 4-carboxy-4-hydroxy-2-oxoadipate aldolase/oxaloacetate decarboxylase [Nocardioidaceae bacterium]
MSGVVVTQVPRAPLDLVDSLAGFGVATVHEAIGRTGLVGPCLRPIQEGVCIAGNAVTVLCWAGDNLMIHAAVEQCVAGDVLVVTTRSPCQDGAFGELLATSLMGRGVRGLVTTAGVRDVAALRRMGFPVWAAAVSAQGTTKSTGGAVNVPVVVGGTVIEAGDVVVCDDDDVLCVPRGRVPEAVELARVRTDAESATRELLARGELTVDLFGLRDALRRAGVEYRSSTYPGQYELT